MRPFHLAVTRALLLVVCGCGGNGTPPMVQVSIASGNWAVLLFSQGNPPIPFNLGGSLMQQGNTISGILHAPVSPCFDPVADDLVVNGTVTGQRLTLNTVPVRGQTISISATLPALNGTSVLNGNYTSAGSTCIGASGTAAAVLVPPLTGTFKGPVTGSLTANLTATLTQSGPDAHGFFHLTGDFSFSGSPCFSSGTIASSTLSGIEADFVINTNDGGQTAVTGLNTLVGLVDNLSAILIVQSGTCTGFAGNGTLAKQ